MMDPLADVVGFLQPTATHVKSVHAAGRWRVRRSEEGQPFFCALLQGSCWLAAAGHAPALLQAGDFVLIPETFDFTVSSMESPPPRAADTVPVALGDGEFRVGGRDLPADVRMLVGCCTFASPDRDVLVSLLPDVAHVHGNRELNTLAELARSEFRGHQPARDMVLARLLEVLFILAFRAAGTRASRGLMRGLADARLAPALRQMHTSPGRAWTVMSLAQEAALSRSAFFARFRRVVGMAPMAYLSAWRMALAKRMLCADKLSVATVAIRVGYESASAFSVAFTRCVGVPPTRYAHAGHLDVVGTNPAAGRD